MSLYSFLAGVVVGIVVCWLGFWLVTIWPVISPFKRKGEW